MIESNKEAFIAYPKRISIIGGGRWARVLIKSLCDLTSPSVKISVHSRHNFDLMSSWALKWGLERRVTISSKKPEYFELRPDAVIVVNAARDHERTIEEALFARIPVLAEKPISFTLSAASRLAELAQRQNVNFAAAHVFLFARHIENFSKLVSEVGDIKSLHVCWADPSGEKRYGEPKSYDPGVPIFIDWLPHVLPIIDAVGPGLPQKCERVKVSRGGAELGLELKVGDIPCFVKLVRNGDQRQRVIDVSTSNKTARLDFSTEPGTIIWGSKSLTGDLDWGSGERPVARMLRAFLQWIAGEQKDYRFNIEIALKTMQVMDQTLKLYQSALVPWIMKRLSDRSEAVDNALLYALSEIFQIDGPLSTSVIHQQTGWVQQKFSHLGSSYVSQLKFIKSLVERKL